MDVAPEVHGAFSLATYHASKGWYVDWQGKRRMINQRHANKAQKLFARAFKLHKGRNGNES